MDSQLILLQEILRQEIEIADKLSEILDDEYSALIKRDLPAIESTATLKLDYVSKLDTLRQRREKLMSEAGLNPGETGLQDFLHHAGGTRYTNVSALWQKLTISIADTKKQNSINGEIVAAMRRQTQNALAILRGVAPNHEPCYSPAGQSVVKIPSQVLAKI